METSFRALLLRYLFPVGLMRRPRGDVFLQRSMLLSNLEALRRWMPHYVRVHAVLSGLMGAGCLLGAHLGAPLPLLVLAAAAAGVELVLLVVFGSTALAARIPTPRGY